MSEPVMIGPGPVLKTIDSAFLGTTPPGNHALVVGEDFEALAIRGLLMSCQWPHLDLDALDAYDDQGDLSAIVAFMDPRATIYFMPALLKYLVSKGQSIGLLLRNILRGFTAGKGPFDPTSYSVDQRGAISLVMAYLEQVFEAHAEHYDLALVRECREAWSNNLARLDVGHPLAGSI